MRRRYCGGSTGGSDRLILRWERWRRANTRRNISDKTRPDQASPSNGYIFHEGVLCSGQTYLVRLFLTKWDSVLVCECHSHTCSLSPSLHHLETGWSGHLRHQLQLLRSEISAFPSFKQTSLTFDVWFSHISIQTKGNVTVGSPRLDYLDCIHPCGVSWVLYVALRLVSQIDRTSNI